jgi:phage tail-like protein
VFGVRNTYAGNYTRQTKFVDSVDPYSNWDGWGETASLAYNVFRCWVSEYTALPDLDANATAVAIESIKLENEG